MPLAYSYIRFSSSKQAKGDSLRRQLKKAQEYAAEHGLTLDDSLQLRDLGVSAYDSSNATRGALAGFLVELRAGRVQKGSYLLVEQLDRLSRADVYTAIGLMQEIVEAGVTVVTLQDRRVFDKVSVKDLGNIMLSVAVMFRAHEESRTKSERIASYWQGKREARPEVFTAQCPRWLTIRPDRSGYVVLEDRAESVRKVFQLTADGHGNVMIARRANLEKWPVPGRAADWHPTLITKLLNNRAVLGEYQPHTKSASKRVPIGDPWKDYYPRIVSDELFARAKASKATRAQLPRRRDDRYLNVFQGVLKCGACGASLSRKYKGSKVQPNYVQYQCTSRIRGVTTCTSVSALKLTEPLLRAVFEHGFVSVADDDFTAHFREIHDAAEQELRDERARLDRLVNALLQEPDSNALISRLRPLELSVQQKEAKLREAQEHLGHLAAATDGPKVEGGLREALERLDGDEHIDYRARLHDRVTRLVARIDVHADHAQAVLHWRAGAEPTAVSLDTGSNRAEQSESPVTATDSSSETVE